MNKKPFDLKNSAKFKDRVAKIEGNQYAKILKTPLAIDLDGRKGYVACIGLNDSYLIVSYGDQHVNPESFWLEVFWTKSDGFNQPTVYHGLVTTVVLNWLMMADSDTDLIKVRHGDLNVLKIALQTLHAGLGEEFMHAIGEEVSIYVQGTLRTIDNPYHRK